MHASSGLWTHIHLCTFQAITHTQCKEQDTLAAVTLEASSLLMYLDDYQPNVYIYFKVNYRLKVVSGGKAPSNRHARAGFDSNDNQTYYF